LSKQQNPFQSAHTESAMQSFKATLGGDTRRFTMAEATSGFAALMAMLVAAFKSAVTVSWTDDEGDQISVRNDADLAECLASVGDGGRATVRLTLAAAPTVAMGAQGAARSPTSTLVDGHGDGESIRLQAHPQPAATGGDAQKEPGHDTTTRGEASSL
jgi:hypothetical protein